MSGVADPDSPGNDSIRVPTATRRRVPIVTWDPVLGASAYEVEVRLFTGGGCTAAVNSEYWDDIVATNAWTPLGAEPRRRAVAEPRAQPGARRLARSRGGTLVLRPRPRVHGSGLRPEPHPPQRGRRLVVHRQRQRPERHRTGRVRVRRLPGRHVLHRRQPDPGLVLDRRHDGRRLHRRADARRDDRPHAGVHVAADDARAGLLRARLARPELHDGGRLRLDARAGLRAAVRHQRHELRGRDHGVLLGRAAGGAAGRRQRPRSTRRISTRRRRCRPTSRRRRTSRRCCVRCSAPPR